MSEHEGRMFDLDNRDKPDARGYPSVEEVITVSDSKFPALIEVDGTLKIVEHHELPIGVSFRILEIAPLSPANVLAACLEWSERQVSDAYASAIDV